MSFGWAVHLNPNNSPGEETRRGVVFIGGNVDEWYDFAESNICWDNADYPVVVAGCLQEPPDGLGLPELEVADTDYLSRDGVRMYDDWYQPRILTFQVAISNIHCATRTNCTGCSACDSGRPGGYLRNLYLLRREWGRYCYDAELVIYTDCHEDFTQSVEPVAINLYHDASFEYGGTGYWSGLNGSNTPSRSTLDFGYGFPSEGRYYLYGQRGAGTGSVYARHTLTNNVLVGHPAGTYTIDFWGLTFTADGSAGFRVSGAGLAGPVVSVATTSAVAQHHTITFTWDGVNPVQFEAWDPAITTNQGFYMDEVILTMTPTAQTWFDGDSQDNATYTYNWQEPANPGLSDSQKWLTAELEAWDAEHDRAVDGPFGIVGRPRGFSIDWQEPGSQIAYATLRFDARDHKMYVLDRCGNYGTEDCEIIEPRTSSACRIYDDAAGCRHYPRCYNQTSGEVVLDTTVTNLGDECACPLSIKLIGRLTNPLITNLTTGQSIHYTQVVLPPGAGTGNVGYALINVCDQTAVDEFGANAVQYVSSFDFHLDPGENIIRLQSYGSNDTGYVQMCWRPEVVSG